LQATAPRLMTAHSSPVCIVLIDMISPWVRRSRSLHSACRPARTATPWRPLRDCNDRQCAPRWARPKCLRLGKTSSQSETLARWRMSAKLSGVDG
jgi:hypothetical protein